MLGQRAPQAARDADQFAWWDALAGLLKRDELRPADKLAFAYLWRIAGGRPGYVDRFRPRDLADFLGRDPRTGREAFERLTALGLVQVVLVERGEYRLWVDAGEAGPAAPRRAATDPQQELFSRERDAVEATIQDDRPQGGERAIAIGGEGFARRRRNDEGADGGSLPPSAALPSEIEAGNSVQNSPPISPRLKNQEGSECIQTKDQDLSGQGALGFLERRQRAGKSAQDSPQAEEAKTIGALVAARAGGAIGDAGRDDTLVVSLWASTILERVNGLADPRDERTRFPATAAADVAMAIVTHGLKAEAVQKALACIAAAKPKNAGAYAHRSFERLCAHVGAPYRRKRSPK